MNGVPGSPRPTELPALTTALEAAPVVVWWFVRDDSATPELRWANAAGRARSALPTVAGRPLADLVADVLAGRGPSVLSGAADGVPAVVTLTRLDPSDRPGVLVLLQEHPAEVVAPDVVDRAAQEVLLPTSLPLLPGARVTGSYSRAGRPEAAGGDWYDAVAVGGGRLALVVGDGVGSGLTATSAMARLRGAWLAEVRRDPGPAAVLGALEALAVDMDDVRGSSLCHVLLDAGTGELWWAAAGHPPPFLARPDGSVERLTADPRPPLGSRYAEPVQVHTARLAEDGALVLVSDGALHVPDRTPEDCWAALSAAAVTALRDGEDESGLAGRVAGAVLPATGADDDVAVLAVRRSGAVRPVHLDLLAVPSSLPAVRRALGAWLAAVGLGAQEVVAVQVAVGEACANSVEHAYPADAPGRLWLDARADDDGTLTVVVRDAGHWRTPDEDPGDRGRGLLIMRQLSSDVVVDAAAGGTTVTLRVPLRGLLDDVPEETDGVDAAVVDRSGGIPTVTVTGALDTAAASGLRIRLLEASRGGAVPARLDLRGVTELSSAAVSVVLEIGRVGHGEGWELEVCAPTGSMVRHVLDLAGVPAVAVLL
ncbi:SpoIIE family protein phosphatase [Modestobacter sp. Leaf380]|uniref:SpoIIE family protein phosphatase n=1 Tax=Modestobacter sp. Leaf380 TaxID=1736356 RepID=UPI0006FC5C35|nr:SpoIIE family protein phosphatase [Modestobacter sp. Leaf380]KQS71553.1 hypothetical protein ASG41_20030 [Modestobacter sp. Leaf380]